MTDDGRLRAPYTWLAAAVVAVALTLYAGRTNIPFFPDVSRAEPCAAAHRVVFVHVMKTAGLSFGSQLGCLCTKLSKCRVARRDVPGSIGHPDCAAEPASVLTTHDSLSKVMASEWGGRDEMFAHPAPSIGGGSVAFVTILREPESRVWSYYKYTQTFSKRYRQRPLSYFLSAINQTLGGDRHGSAVQAHPEEAVAVATSRLELHRDDLQLTNMMARSLGAQPAELLVLPVTTATLNTALANLRQFAVVGFIDELDAFAERMSEKWPLLLASRGALDERAGSGQRGGESRHALCPMPHENAALNSTFVTASAHPDLETRALIRDVNRVDAELYAAAKAHARKRR